MTARYTRCIFDFKSGVLGIILINNDVKHAILVTNDLFMKGFWDLYEWILRYLKKLLLRKSDFVTFLAEILVIHWSFNVTVVYYKNNECCYIIGCLEYHIYSPISRIFGSEKSCES